MHSVTPKQVKVKNESFHNEQTGFHEAMSTKIMSLS